MSEGRRYAGMEHWLPLFHERLDTLFDYLPGVPVVFDNHVEDAVGERLAQVKDYYDARKSALGDAAARRRALQAAAARCALSQARGMGGADPAISRLRA